MPTKVMVSDGAIAVVTTAKVGGIKTKGASLTTPVSTSTSRSTGDDTSLSMSCEERVKVVGPLCASPSLVAVSP